MSSKSVKKETIRWKTKAGEAREAEAWVARYRDEARHQHKKNFRRRVDADRWLDEITASIVTGRYVDPGAGKISLQDFYNDWSSRQIWRSNSRESADHAVKTCTFAALPLSAIRKSHVESWVKQMDAVLAPSTIGTRFTIVRSVLRAAVTDKLIAEDPAAGVALPAKRKRAAAMTIPAPEDVGSLLEHADQTKRVSTRVGFRAFVALGSFAGLRLGEGLGVQVADIDFLRRQLRVERQIQRAKAPDIAAGKETIEATGGIPVLVLPPKYGSERTVFLPDELLQILAEHIAAHTPGGSADRWLFADEQGRPWHDNAVTWRWRATRSAAGVDARLHDLRHFYASGLIAAGCDVVTVQRAMGHASATTTLNTYSHLWPTAEDRTRAAASELARQAITGRKPGAKGSKDTLADQPSQHA